MCMCMSIEGLCAARLGLNYKSCYRFGVNKKYEITMRKLETLYITADVETCQHPFRPQILYYQPLINLQKYPVSHHSNHAAFTSYEPQHVSV